MRIFDTFRFCASASPIISTQNTLIPLTSTIPLSVRETVYVPSPVITVFCPDSSGSIRTTDQSSLANIKNAVYLSASEAGETLFVLSEAIAIGDPTRIRLYENTIPETIAAAKHIKMNIFRCVSFICLLLSICYLSYLSRMVTGFVYALYRICPPLFR